MIKHDLKNWIYTNDLEGLLFFAQRLNEALFDFSPDRYKAPTLFTISSCLELLRTASSVKNGVFPLKTLETVFEEFKSIYNKDIIAQELVGVDAKNYFLEITESNLEKFNWNRVINHENATKRISKSIKRKIKRGNSFV